MYFNISIKQAPLARNSRETEKLAFFLHDISTILLCSVGIRTGAISGKRVRSSAGRASTNLRFALHAHIISLQQYTA